VVTRLHVGHREKVLQARPEVSRSPSLSSGTLGAAGRRLCGRRRSCHEREAGDHSDSRDTPSEHLHLSFSGWNDPRGRAAWV